jgi:hypothetical protein
MPNKLFIPRLGTILLLAEDWTFKLQFEHRNATLMKALGPKEEDVDADSHKAYHRHWYGYDPEDFKGVPGVEVGTDRAMSDEQLDRAYASYRATNARDVSWLRVTLPKNTTLVVDRIYIRRGGEAFDSVTFRIPKNKKLSPELAKFGGTRFWVKLNEANNIVCDVVG